MEVKKKVKLCQATYPNFFLKHIKGYSKLKTAWAEGIKVYMCSGNSTYSSIGLQRDTTNQTKKVVCGQITDDAKNKNGIN